MEYKRGTEPCALKNIHDVGSQNKDYNARGMMWQGDIKYISTFVLKPISLKNKWIIIK